MLARRLSSTSRANFLPILESGMANRTVRSKATTPLTTSILKGEQISVAHLRPGVIEMEASTHDHSESAFIVTLQLRDLTHAELWLGDEVVSRGPLNAGSISIVDADGLPRYRLSSDFDCLQFHVPAIALAELAKNFGMKTLDTIAIREERLDPVMLRFGRLLLTFFDAEVCNSQSVIDHLLLAVCGHLTSKYGRHECDQAFPLLASWQKRAAQRMILGNLSRMPPVKDIARACKLSTKELAARFRRTTGMTMSRWHSSVRVDTAKKLLFESDMALSDIALECGFVDQSHFTRSFAEHVGMPPGAWRRGHSGARSGSHSVTKRPDIIAMADAVSTLAARL